MAAKSKGGLPSYLSPGPMAACQGATIAETVPGGWDQRSKDLELYGPRDAHPSCRTYTNGDSPSCVKRQRLVIAYEAEEHLTIHLDTRNSLASYLVFRQCRNSLKSLSAIGAGSGTSTDRTPGHTTLSHDVTSTPTSFVSPRSL